MNPPPGISRARRALATLIDGIVIFCLFILVIGIYYAGLTLIGTEVAQAVDQYCNKVESTPAQQIPKSMLYLEFGCLFIPWLYYVQLESSRWRGTLGKRIMGLKVVNFDGNSISVIRATLRFFFAVLRVAIFFCMISFWFSVPMIIGADQSSKTVDYFGATGAGMMFLLVFFRSGKRGQRLQDFCTRTRVVPRSWEPDVIDASTPTAKPMTDTPKTDGIFKFTYRLLWIAIFIVPAYYIYREAKPDIGINSSPATTNTTSSSKP